MGASAQTEAYLASMRARDTRVEHAHRDAIAAIVAYLDGCEGLLEELASTAHLVSPTQQLDRIRQGKLLALADPGGAFQASVVARLDEAGDQVRRTARFLACCVEARASFGVLERALELPPGALVRALEALEHAGLLAAPERPGYPRLRRPVALSLEAQGVDALEWARQLDHALTRGAPREGTANWARAATLLDASDEHEAAARCALAAHEAGLARGRADLSRPALATVGERLEHLSPGTARAVLEARAHITYHLDEQGDAHAERHERLSAQAVAACADAGDWAGVARVELMRARLLYGRARFEAALEAARGAVEQVLGRRADAATRCAVLAEAAPLELVLGDDARAEHLFDLAQQARERDAALTQDAGTALALTRAAIALRGHGEVARAWASRAAQAAPSGGRLWVASLILGVEIDLCRGHDPEVDPEELQRISDTLGLEHFEGAARTLMGWQALFSGHHERARDLLLGISRHTGPYHEALSDLWVAACDVALARPALARQRVAWLLDAPRGRQAPWDQLAVWFAFFSLTWDDPDTRAHLAARARDWPATTPLRRASAEAILGERAALSPGATRHEQTLLALARREGADRQVLALDVQGRWFRLRGPPRTTCRGEDRCGDCSSPWRAPATQTTAPSRSTSSSSSAGPIRTTSTSSAPRTASTTPSTPCARWGSIKSSHATRMATSCGPTSPWPGPTRRALPIRGDASPPSRHRGS
jgi:DNA-binding transcriptional ArsR family regulator